VLSKFCGANKKRISGPLKFISVNCFELSEARTSDLVRFVKLCKYGGPSEDAKAPQGIATRTKMTARVLKSELLVQSFESEAVNDSVVNQNREPKSRGEVRMLL
jgi:hypothetical protein